MNRTTVEFPNSIEQLFRIVDECNDIDALKEQTKQFIRLYFMQRDTATTLLLQKV